MKKWISCLFLLVYLSGCVRIDSVDQEELSQQATVLFKEAESKLTPTAEAGEQLFQTKRPNYMPGELVDYQVQSGDNLPALAARFNTTEAEIRKANPVLPEHTTTLPQGLPLKIPIYFRSGWASSFQILPDGLFVNGPAQSGFSARSFVDRQEGWFKYYSTYSSHENRRGGELVDYAAINYSISPRLLLAILEYMTGALTNPEYPDDINTSSVLKMDGEKYRTLSAQFNQISDFLNGAYYNYREGKLIEFELQDGSLYRIDPWQNAASAALQVYFAHALSPEAYHKAVSPDGFVLTYKKLFGDFPEVNEYPANLEGSLEQPELSLPFPENQYWTLTGGPHAGWGSNRAYAAIDFAPPTTSHGCFISNETVTAPHEGIIVRKDTGLAILDLDGDGDEHTGWVMLFLHLKTESIPPVGTHLNKGDFIGHPSCDGGTASGTHVHLARKYNGEWIAAGGVIPLLMDGWKAADGAAPYQGTLTRYSSIVTASSQSEYFSQIYSGPPLVPTKLPHEKK